MSGGDASSTIPESRGAALSCDGIFVVTAVRLFRRWRGWHPDPESAGARPCAVA
jgi:hypothetical protein